MREQIQASSRSLLNRFPQDSASFSHRGPELAAAWLLVSCWASQATIRNKENVPSSRSFCFVIAKWSQPGWPISEKNREQIWVHARGSFHHPGEKALVTPFHPSASYSRGVSPYPHKEASEIFPNFNTVLKDTAYHQVCKTAHETPCKQVFLPESSLQWAGQGLPRPRTRR